MLYEYRMSAIPADATIPRWQVKVWIREISENVENTGWKCVYDQDLKYRVNTQLPSKLWQMIVQSTIA